MPTPCLIKFLDDILVEYEDICTRKKVILVGYICWGKSIKKALVKAVELFSPKTLVVGANKNYSFGQVLCQETPFNYCSDCSSQRANNLRKAGGEISLRRTAEAESPEFPASQCWNGYQVIALRSPAKSNAEALSLSNERNEDAEALSLSNEGNEDVSTVMTTFITKQGFCERLSKQCFRHFPYLSNLARRSSSGLKATLVLLHMVFIGVLFLFDTDLMRNTHELWYSPTHSDPSSFLACSIILDYGFLR